MSLRKLIAEAIQNPEEIIERENGTIEYKRNITSVTEDNLGWASKIREVHPLDGDKIIENINKDLVERMLEIANEKNKPVIIKNNEGIYTPQGSLVSFISGSFDFKVNPGEDLKEAQNRFIQERIDAGNRAVQRREQHVQDLNNSELAKARNRVAKAVDNVLGSNFEGKKLPLTLKEIEKVASDKFFKKPER